MTDPQPPKRKPWRRRHGVSRRIKHAGILPATVMVLFALLAGAVIIWVGFTRLLRDAWPWQLGGLETNTPGFQLMQLVLTLIGGIGAAILVFVAYRRQRDLETARFDDRFAAAAAQLGADTAAEQLAGVYAMAALADIWEQHRQQCINVLCAYLRLPYDPSAGLLTEVVSEHTWPVAGVDKDGRGATGKETRTYRTLPNDREVRHTIIRVITEHLRDTATTSWQGHDFDFTRAVFDGGDFNGAHFTGGRVSFDGAEFSGGRVSFADAEFSGGRVSFDGARFSGSRVLFVEARFSGSRVSFIEARFAGGVVVFVRAEFHGGEVSFARAELFSGGRVSFAMSKFSGTRVSFIAAKFSGGGVSFTEAEFYGGVMLLDRARFSGGVMLFVGAGFSGSLVSFAMAEFSGSLVSFAGAKFSGGKVSFDRAGFSGGEVSFKEGFSGDEVSFAAAGFTSSEVSFAMAEFSGSEVLFAGAEFSGGEVSFDGARFSGDVTVRMSPYDSAADRGPSMNGLPFYGWPPRPSFGDADGDDLPPAEPGGT